MACPSHPHKLHLFYSTSPALLQSLQKPDRTKSLDQNVKDLEIVTTLREQTGPIIRGFIPFSLILFTKKS